MIQTRVFEWKEFSKPTVQIFSRYEEKQWILRKEKYEIHITNREIEEYTKEKINLWNRKNECRRVWLGINSSQSWKKILKYRNKTKNNISFSFYLNSLIGLSESISASIEEMVERDMFVFNSCFAKETFEKTISRTKKVYSCINSVSTANIETKSLERAQWVKKNEQICIFSRLNHYKNIHQLLEAIDESKWQGKIIVGVLPNKNNIGEYYKNHLQNIIRKSNLNVEGMRAYDQKEINKIMSNSVACVVLSTSFEETQGKVIIEAASNCCLPIANRWNGHQDFLPKNYIGNINTKWNEAEGINIDKKELVEAIKNISSLYRIHKQTYVKICKEILDKITNICSEERQIINPQKIKHYNYLNYIEHFAKIRINKDKWEYCKPSPKFNIDFYIWRRKMYEGNSTDENLRNDYECLKEHIEYYQYAQLLDLITTDCLFYSVWESKNLLRIVELIESRNIYHSWSNQTRRLFKLC